MAYGGPRAATDLFAPVLLASQLHLAHAAGADGLAQDPLARLGGNGGARSCLLGSGRLLVLLTWKGEGSELVNHVLVFQKYRALDDFYFYVTGRRVNDLELDSFCSDMILSGLTGGP